MMKNILMAVIISYSYYYTETETIKLTFNKKTKVVSRQVCTTDDQGNKICLSQTK